METQERITKGQIKAKIIIEMMGAPKEHIESTIKQYVEKLKESDLFEIVDEKFFPAEEQGKLFSTFTELDIWFKNMDILAAFCFEAMPSSIEIIEPLDLNFKGKALENLFNEILGKLHDLDLLVKQVRAEKQLIDTNAVHVLNNFIIHLLDKPKTAAEIGAKIGIQAKQTESFLKKLIEQDKIKQENGVYSLK